MKISVIIPMYNPGKEIVRCFKSLENQTFTDYELILIDDGSKDLAYKAVERYIGNSSLKNKARLVRQENAGVALTRNRGIEMAEGDYLAFIDQDDFVAKDYLENLYKAATEVNGADKDDSPIDIVVSGYERVRSDGRIILKRDIKDAPWTKYTMITPWAHLYRREFIVDNNIRFLDTKIGEDVYFNLPAYTYTDKIVILKDRGYKWFYNEKSVSNVSHKTLDSKLDVLLLLDSVYDKLAQVDANDSEEMQYYYMRFVCWFMLYATRGSKRENIVDAYKKVFGWLRSKYPNYRKSRYRGFRMPDGEEVSFHEYVAVFYLLERMHLLLFVLKLFGK
ncbi:MAG: glycosyltransferase [Eubacterium sp.]|nr:glycosyltransferase [Eubacterium sp.]